MGKGDCAAMRSCKKFFIPVRMNIHLYIAFFLLILFMNVSAQIGGMAGGFSRMGFGARGQAMGNAMSAITTGTIATYYNPALAPFQEGHLFYGNYSFLSLDRKFNQISYTQNLYLRRKDANNFDTDPDLQSIVGFSAGWTNAGDANIDGRDDDGFKTKTLGAFENQFYFTVANLFSDRLAIGLSFKFYYSGFNVFFVNNDFSITSSGFGVDAGVLYRLSDNINVALVAKELVTKYRWDTGNIYGSENGKSTENPFVRLYRLGASYVLPDTIGVIGGEIELSSEKTILARFGGEYHISPLFTARLGIDRLQLKDSGFKPTPSLGFTVHQPIGAFSPSVSYAIIYEPISLSFSHVLSVALLF